MMRAAALAALLAAVAACSGSEATRVRHRKTAASLEPARLRPTPTEGPALGTARVRVYADSAYRTQNPGHTLEIQRLFGKVSRLLELTIGLRLEVTEVRDWKREGGNDLQAALAELEYLDPAQDVDWVVGMVNALGQVSSELHQLGYARVLGRHVVLRGLNDAAEVLLLEEVLSSLGARQRQELYSRRKRHKEQVLVLHELAHTLGAMHVTDARDFLYPSYENTQAGFGKQNARLMRAAASARMAPDGRDDQREWRAVLDYLRQNPWDGWNEDEKSQLMTELDSRVRDLQAGKQDALSEKLRPADREHFRAAERLEAAGRAADAWEEVEPLIEYYPDEPGVHRLACRLAVAAGRDRSSIESRCARAVQVTPNDAEPHLRLAQAYLAAKENARSLASARKAMELLEGGGEVPGADRMWADLAAHFQGLGAVSLAEKAASRAKDGKEIAEWARLTRARYGMAPGGPVKPEREAEYVAGIRELLTAVYDRRFPEAEKRAAALQRSFGGAAGIASARCDLEIRRRRYPAARAHCREALRRYKDSSWAHYLTGLLDKLDKRTAAAIEHIERAIALDPELEHAYQIAAEMYGQSGRQADRKRIADAFKAKFGRDMP